MLDLRGFPNMNVQRFLGFVKRGISMSSQNLFNCFILLVCIRASIYASGVKPLLVFFYRLGTGVDFVQEYLILLRFLFATDFGFNTDMKLENGSWPVILCLCLPNCLKIVDLMADCKEYSV